MKRAIIFLVLLWAVPCWAADLLNFPPDCDTPGEKVEYSYRAQELLRFEHNVISYWLHCGLTQDEYDNGLLADGKGDLCSGVNEVTTLGPKLKAVFPYKEYLTESDYFNYWDNHFVPRQSKVGSECVINRKACLKDPFCQSSHFRTVDGPDGPELQPKKDLWKVSIKYPVVVDDIPKTQAVSIDR